MAQADREAMMGWQRDGSGLAVKRISGMTLPQYTLGGPWWIGRRGRPFLVAETDLARFYWRDRIKHRRRARRGLAS
jgi:hypothetical protein